jgi:hypothetical protein
LHKALETYPVPVRIRGGSGSNGPVSNRIYPIFRDREELPVHAQRVLDYLVVELGKRAFSEMATSPSVDTFVASETLYVLSTLAQSPF